jgi:hypothetical protein
VGWAVKLAIVVLVLVVLLGAADVGSRLYAQRQVAHQIDTRVPGASSSVHISSFPFLGNLALSGKIDKVSAKVKHVTEGQFSFDEVDLTLTGVKLDRHQLVTAQQVHINSINTGTVRAAMSQQAVDQALGFPVSFTNGGVQATVDGQLITASVTIVNNELRIEWAGAARTIPVPKLPVLPCAARAVFVPGHMELTCTFHEVPSALLATAAG